MLKLKQRASMLLSAFTGRAPSAPVNVRMQSAGLSRLTQGWNAYQQAADDVLAYKIGTLRARARALAEENGEAQGLLLDFEADIIGASGAKLQFRSTKARGGPLEAVNDRIEWRWWDWCQKGACTLDGFDDMVSLQRLMIRTVIVDGEFFAIKHRGRQYTDGFKLQPIDADLVDDTYNRGPDADGVSIVMGVEIDRHHKPLFYHIFDRHPNSTGARVRRAVPAADVLHVFKRVRVGQTRGVTWFAPALVTWKLNDQYTESELVQSMLAAAQGGFFEKEDDTGGGTFPTRTVTENGVKKEVPIDISVEPGVSRALPPGWSFKPWQPTHPTANFSGFVKVIKRIIARTFGRSYASVTGDLESVNFSSIRTDRVREMEQNRMHQDDILVRQFMTPIFLEWFGMADLQNRLGVLPFSAADIMRYVSWMCRGWPWIDPLKDAAAAQLGIQMRITSPQRVCAERGFDVFEIIDEIAEVEAYAKAKGVTMDAVNMALSFDASDADAEKKDTAEKARTLRIAA